MAQITAAMVKELREMTGAGMMDCKKALAATDGDKQKAIDFLREKGIAKAEKKAGRIAAEGARFSLPEVQLGLSPDMGGTSRLTRLVGLGQAKRLILTGEEVDAQEALRIGLVEVVVPPEELEARAMKMAKTIARSPAAAVRFAKKGVNLTDEGGLYAGRLFEQAQSTYCCGTEDLQNAIAAYKAMLAARSKK